MGTAESADGVRSAADRLGIVPGMAVQEVGRDDDIDADLVDALIERTGTDLVDEGSDDVVDVVLLWFREDDGDLVDALMDARTRLDNNGAIWVLTPKSGRDGHVELRMPKEAKAGMDPWEWSTPTTVPTS